MKPVSHLGISLIVSLLIISGLAYGASQLSSHAESDSANLPDAVGVSDHGGDTEVQGLEIIVLGIRGDQGKVVAAVFNDKEAFEAYDYDRSIRYGEFKANKAVKGAVRLPFPRLRSGGPYAISLFHDENNDDDFNYEGDYPTEGWGTSGAKDMWDEPTFEEASVTGGRVIVQMYYAD
ncbi:MAG: DUF2141 domain-containing protein [Pseudomonadota bacterium]